MTDEAERLARLPLLAQRALLRIAHAAADSTESEKRVATAALDRLAAHEKAPEKLRELVKMLSSLVGAVQAQADTNYLARSLTTAAEDEGTNDDGE
ncbi:hypothetical protein ACFQDH_20380 [Flexivirga alba]|uniref:Uncharacterized protein n=1 Tax=Flexivirga alba TaxID=702742 RepID=A0ABW2AKS1_9MICO